MLSFQFYMQKNKYAYIFDLCLSPEVHFILENLPHSTEESGDLCRILPHGNNGRILFRRTDVIRSSHYMPMQAQLEGRGIVPTPSQPRR